MPGNEKQLNYKYGTRLGKSDSGRQLNRIRHSRSKLAKSSRSITQSYYRSAHALILVYDISCQPTFDALTDWIREIQEYANPKVLKILVGNKTDRDDREIPTRIGEEFAKQHEMYFLETSSKQGENGKVEKC